MTGPDEMTSDYRAAREDLLAQPLVAPAQRRAALADLTDRWVAQLFTQATAATGSEGLALIAAGGYGRRELSPGSDIDLVLLHDPAAASRAAAAADSIWYPIWDSTVKLDHSVRTPAQARRLANTDVKVMLGLLDARTIVGDASLLTGLRSSALADWRARASQRLGDLRELIAARRRAFGELAYLQEPDLKDSIGGLRDVVIMRAVAASSVTDVPHGRLNAPYALLLDVRDALHTVTGRGSDRLVRQEQAAVAAALGIADPGGDGDGTLRAVAGAGRTIDWVSDLVWHRVDRAESPSRLSGLRRRGGRRQTGRLPLVEGAVVDDGVVVLARDARPSRDPGMVLRIAGAAARADLRIAPATVQRLAETTTAPPVPWTDAMRQDFLGLVGAGSGAVPIWEALDQENLIVRYLPEWEATRSAPQHNPVHVYTVDRHSLETAVKASSLAREVSRPDLLVTAALLHDIGKPAGAAEHSEVGARMIAEIAPRMGFAQEDTAILVTLVRHHLLLAETATRRDIYDDVTVATVADQVGTLEILELLLALTKADAEATGPLASSPWRAALIDRLAERVASRLAGSPEPALPGPTAAEQSAAESDDVVVLRADRGGLHDIVVGAPVAPLADIAALLAHHRLRVIEARAREVGTRSVSTWRVVAAFGEVPDAGRLAADLRRVLDGTLDLRERLLRRGSGEWSPAEGGPAPRVVILPGASETATVLEVRAADSVALLFRLLLAIADQGVSVRAAKVSTLGADVVDVFYLVDEAGEPLTNGSASTVRDALLEAAVTFRPLR